MRPSDPWHVSNVVKTPAKSLSQLKQAPDLYVKDRFPMGNLLSPISLINLLKITQKTCFFLLQWIDLDIFVWSRHRLSLSEQFLGLVWLFKSEVNRFFVYISMLLLVVTYIQLLLTIYWCAYSIILNFMLSQIIWQ